MLVSEHQLPAVEGLANGSAQGDLGESAFLRKA